MRIFITGGTGFVGGHIIDLLLKEKHEVVVLARSIERGDRLVKKGANIVTGDLMGMESFAKHLEKVDAVIHLVGILVETRGEGTYEQVHFESTKNIVDAAKAAGIKKYVHMSALGAEEGAQSEYHKTKFMAEEYVKASGLDYTVFKPSVIYGEGDAFVNMYAGMLKISPFVPVIGDGRVKMQPVYVGDIARVFAAAVSGSGHSGETYEVGGPDKLSFDEIVDAIARAMNKRVFKIHLPMKLMEVNAAVMRPILKKPPISKDQLLMLKKDNVCDITKITDSFSLKGEDALVSFEDGIKKYLLR